MRTPFTKLAQLLALSCLLTLTLGISQALAADSGYVGVGSFGSGPDSADGTFNGPRRVAVNTTSGKVYVVDSANDRVEVFAPNGGSADFDSHLGVGELDGPHGIAIDQSNGDIYVSSVDNEKIVRFNEDGSVDNGFTSPLKGKASGKLGSFAAALAVDSTGDLLVADPGHDLIGRYADTGTFEESYDGSDSPDGLFAGLLDIAVDSSDRILVVDSTGNVVEGASSRVLRFSAAGAYQASLEGVPQAGVVAFDPNTGYVLVGGNLSLFAGTRLYVFDDTTRVTDLAYPGDNSGTIAGLAVDNGGSADRQHVYAVGDLDQFFNCCGSVGVQVLGAATLPDAAIDPPSAIQEFSAHLSGTVNPQGVQTGWYFEYSSDGSSWTPVQADQDAGNGTGDVAVSDDLTGLTHNTQYFVRLVATSSEGAIRTSPQETFTTATIPPPTATVDSPTAITGEGAHLNGTVDPNGFETTFTFQVSSDGGATWKNAGSGNAGDGSDATPVGADVSGLDPNTGYEVRLVAANGGGETVSDPPNATFTTDAVAPTAETTGADHLQPSSVQLNGRVNPQNLATTYHFEWGTQDCASSECASVPVPDASAGAGGGLTVVSQSVEGLDADTTYHYRLVATNAEGSAAGADRTFATTTPAADCTNTAARAEQHSQLPDCRAWELVSPPDKNGADVLYESVRTRVSVNGDAAMFSSLGVFSDAQSSGISSEYIAQRTGGGGQGWTTHSITPKVDAVDVNTPLFYGGDSRWLKMSDDLSKGAYMTFTNFSDDPNVSQVPNLYRRGDLLTPGAGTYDLVSGCPVCSSPLSPLGNNLTIPVHANSDYSEVYFENQQTRVADASGAGMRLYKWDADTATVTAAGVLPDGTVADRSVAGAGFNEGESTNAVSDGSDGHTRVYFGVPELAFGGNPQELYMRVDDTTTYQVNASERTDCAGDPTCGGDDIPNPAPASPAPALFQIASADGTRAFFTSEEPLTDDAQGGPQLYMYDASLPDSHPHNLTLVSRDEEPRDGSGPVTSVLGASADGAWVYFTADRSQLEQGGPRDVSDGHDSIYVWHDGTIRYIATERDGSSLRLSFLDGLDNPPFGSQGTHPARVSPDGRHLLIHTYRGMKGLPESNGLLQLALYDADAHVLSCASCGSAPPTTDAEPHSLTGYGTVFPTTYRNHPLTADGQHVFFNTGDALVAEDTNGKIDAYEYDASTGEHHLLSSGRGTQDSYFMDATPDGSDVFVVSGSNLLGWDTDRNYDLYDVRVNGGFPEPTGAQGDCLSSDECQGAPAGAPAAELPRSAGFTGAGNDTSSRCERLSRQAKTLRRSALRLSRQAKRAKSERVRRAKSRRATRLRKRGRALSAQARTCQKGLAR
jgi:hypothetical protein